MTDDEQQIKAPSTLDELDKKALGELLDKKAKDISNEAEASHRKEIDGLSQKLERQDKDIEGLKKTQEKLEKTQQDTKTLITVIITATTTVVAVITFIASLCVIIPSLYNFWSLYNEKGNYLSMSVLSFFVETSWMLFLSFLFVVGFIGCLSFLIWKGYSYLNSKSKGKK